MGLLENFSSGLFIIQSVIFLVLIFVLRKFAWKPIMDAVNEREVTIVDSLNQAK
ncbi:MAG TPA: F0F1 ATP synthase subunit B, partial [Kaistella sp.]|nr:F0F1 ATP synthase subunit B [Kaistella sp.]